MLRRTCPTTGVITPKHWAFIGGYTQEWRGTILLVDDGDMVIRVGKTMLEKLGCQVWVSRNRPEAVDAVKEKGDAIDIVIPGLITPGMDGGG